MMLIAELLTMASNTITGYHGSCSAILKRPYVMLKQHSIPIKVYSILYGSAPLPNNRCGFLAATSRIVWANTELAQANQLPEDSEQPVYQLMKLGTSLRV